MASEPIVQVLGVHKFFTRGSEQIDVLQDLSLEVSNGEFLGLMGPSGSGKTTLLTLIAGLVKPSHALGNGGIQRNGGRQVRGYGRSAGALHTGFVCGIFVCCIVRVLSST